MAVQNMSTKWSFSKGETDDEFFLMIGDVRALNPKTRMPFGKIENLLCGRSSEELLIKFVNCKSGRHLIRSNFDHSTDLGKKIDATACTSNRLFISSFESLTGRDSSDPPTQQKKKRRKVTPGVTFLTQEDHPECIQDSNIIPPEKFLGEKIIKKEFLMEPPANILLRNTRNEWVEDITKRLTVSGELSLPALGKILPVMVDPQEMSNAENFDISKCTKFLTLGGNHLRKAIQKVESIKEVSCHVFVNLTDEEALLLAVKDNDAMKSLPFTFQDKVSLARKFHNQGVTDLNKRMKEVLGRIEMKEIKDSISTILSVARYVEDNFNTYDMLVNKYERENGVGQNIPQKLFKLLQGESEMVRAHYLDMALTDGIKSSIQNLETSRKEKAVERIFVQQTKCKDWEEAVERFPNYTTKIKELKGLKQQNQVPKVLLDMCQKAVETNDEIEEVEVNIAIKIGDHDVSNQDIINTIINKYVIKIREEVSKKTNDLNFEE